jgi:hypothetical protein
VYTKEERKVDQESILTPQLINHYVSKRETSFVDALNGIYIVLH